MKRPETSGGIILDTFPHHQVVAREFKHCFVRGTKFVVRLLPRVEKDAAGNRSHTEPRKDDCTASLRQDVVLQILKRLERLRRQAVFAARQACNE
jgi:hypothetical protein